MENKKTRLGNGTVTLIEQGGITIHCYDTTDALADAAFLIEAEDALVGLELPSFKADSGSWKGYIEALPRRVDAFFVSAHPAGGSLVGDTPVYATRKAECAMHHGSTQATTDGLGAAFGPDFQAADKVKVTDVVEPGDLRIRSLQLRVVDQGDVYDLVIPQAKAVYMHMLGKTVHSIIPSIEAAKAMASSLEAYLDEGLEYFLSSHSGIEGRDAAQEKIRYLDKLVGLASASADGQSFKQAMEEAFPGYAGGNYLDMTVGMLFA